MTFASKEIEEIRGDYVDAFDQQSVLRTDEPSCVLILRHGRSAIAPISPLEKPSKAPPPLGYAPCRSTGPGGMR